MRGRHSLSRQKRPRAGHPTWCVIGVLLLLLSGCDSIVTDYGPSSGTVGRRSLNGFAALRQSFASAGFETHSVQRLSQRTLSHNVLVWTPQTFDSISPPASRWFERWLQQGGRTLVYLVPDSGSEADYWQAALGLTDPDQRLEYRRRAARSVNERMAWRLNRQDVSSNGWFHVLPLQQRLPLTDLQGPWAEGGSLSDSLADPPPAIEFQVDAYDADAAGNTPVPSGVTGSGQTGPSAPPWRIPGETELSSTPTEFVAMLATKRGEAIVAQITSPQWKDSQVLVVAGGSLLTNYAFTRPLGRQLAQQLLAAATLHADPDPHAGFLTTGWEGVSVSETKPGVPQATGMELLTVWPLSLVTIHAMLMGLVICLMLLPIFGRPRRVQYRRLSDFGDHLDAVAALMSKTDGEAYARSRISEYMRRVRGETVGPWVLPESTTSSTTRAGAGTQPLADSTATTNAGPPQPENSHEASP